jgi:hypothetical protein
LPTSIAAVAQFILAGISSGSTFIDAIFLLIQIKALYPVLVLLSVSSLNQSRSARSEKRVEAGVRLWLQVFACQEVPDKDWNLIPSSEPTCGPETAVPDRRTLSPGSRNWTGTHCQQHEDTD